MKNVINMETDDKKSIIVIVMFMALTIIGISMLLMYQNNNIDALKHDNGVLSGQVSQLSSQLENMEDLSKTVGERYNLTLVPYNVYYKCNDGNDFIISIAIGIMDTKDFYHQTDIGEFTIYGTHETDDTLLRSQIYNKMVRFHNIDLGSDNSKYSASVFDMSKSFVIGNLSCGRISG